MATIRAFKAIRPAEEYAARVAALPYDVMTGAEARKMAQDNEYSFLHVTKAEIDLPEDTDPYSAQVYERARANLDKMLADGVLIREPAECLYVYTLVMDGRTQTGLVACASIDEYESGVIKKHEFTREDKEADRIRHIDCCNANTGPVFLAYRDDARIRAKLGEWVRAHAPLYDFTAEDGIRHTVHRIDDAEYIADIERLFSGLPSLYIADGHHRNASAAKVSAMRRQANPGLKDQAYDSYLSVIFPDSDLKILDYNRVVKDLNGSTAARFLERLAEKFEVTEGLVPLTKPHCFGLYLGGEWYTLTAKPGILAGKDVIGLLDVSILQDEVLDKLLGIRDPRLDKRIDFVGGIRGLGELERRVDSGEMALAFAMYPTSMEELMDIADQGKIMPPKSTWFEPKLRSGLFVHSIK